MAEEGPSKTDIQAVFKKLRAAPANKVCFDCGARNPTWSSVTYGVFICIDCSATHRNLGVHITFVRSTQLDTNWTWLQIRAMQVGGNANATQFFKQHGSNTTDAQQKYKSRAASLYRDKLHQLATQAMRLHGTKVHLDGPQLSPLPTEDAVDFFEEHVSTPNLPHNLSQVSMSDDAYIGNQDAVDDGDAASGPSVDHVINADDAPASSEPRKSTLAKKAVPKKATFGAKKGGLGAQRVKANFSEIEQKAADFDAQREENAKFTIAPETPEQSPDVNKLSARLMVQDIDDQRRKQELKLKAQDPKKAEVVDRLGMGGLGRGVASHSVASGIKTIQQEGIRQKSNYNKSRDIDYTTKDEDDWEVLNKEPFGNGSSRKSNKDDDMEESSKKQSNDFFNSWDEAPAEEKRPARSAARSTYEPPAAASDAGAYKKYANAKSISSDQFFGGGATDYETKSNLAKFEGSTGIGSADLFGNGSAKGGGGGGASGAGYYGQVPEMAEIKDSVRQGMGKVAGKISSLGSSVSSYLSDRY